MQSRRTKRKSHRLLFEQLEHRRVLATFTVSNFDDGPVTMPDSLPGSLRQAVFDANMTPGPDDIVFDSEGMGTIALTEGELEITESVIIRGNGTEIDAGHTSRVFNIHGDELAPVDVELHNLILDAGSATDESGGDLGHGGAILSRGNLLIQDSQITNSSAERSGGGVYISAQLDVINSTIDGNSAGFTAGGIWTLGDVSIHESTISNNAAEYGGGLVANGDSVAIDKTTITGNTAGRSGGGLFAPKATISDSLISNNSAADRGGGIHANSGNSYVPEADLHIVGTTIIGNVATTGGGISFEGTLLVDDSQVLLNTAIQSGGGIARTSISSGVIGSTNVVDSIISGNRADGSGGGIAGGRAPVTLTRSTVRDNAAATGGGVDGWSVEVAESTIRGNQASANGGGISAQTVTMSSSQVGSNTAGARGGGLSTSSAYITDSTFEQNRATTDGGGVFAAGILRAEGSDFLNNVAGDEGGAAIAKAVRLTTANVVGNSAGNQGGGLRGSLVVLDQTTVQSNTAGTSGGGVSADDLSFYSPVGYLPELQLRDTTISNNLAATGGGAEVHGPFDFLGSTISRNTAEGSGAIGGGIYVAEADNPSWHSIGVIHSSTIVENLATDSGGGIGISPESQNHNLTLLHVILAKNQADAFPDFSESAADGWSVTYSLIGNPFGVRIDDPTNLVGTIDAPLDPEIGPLQDNGGLTETHLPIDSSPVVNAGDPSAMAGVDGVPEFDQRGTGFSRVIAIIDMGAVETDVLATRDFGDLGGAFPTTSAQDGAAHLAQGPILGVERDAEVDANVELGAALGDDLTGIDDEDGVVAPEIVFLGQLFFEIVVTVSNAATAKLDAWIDLNGDGVWQADERIADARDLQTGENTIRVPINAPPAIGDHGGRFRLSTAGGLDYQGLAPDGEVEDHLVRFDDSVFYNVTNPLDVDGENGDIPTPLDALQIVTDLQLRVYSDPDTSELAQDEVPPVFLDVNNNGLLDPLDALLVIAALPDTASTRLIVDAPPRTDIATTIETPRSADVPVVMQSTPGASLQARAQVQPQVDQSPEQPNAPSALAPSDYQRSDTERAVYVDTMFARWHQDAASELSWHSFEPSDPLDGSEFSDLR